MICWIRETLDKIVTEMELGDNKEAMRRFAGFTLLFEEFLSRNKDFFTGYEIEKMNLCMSRMLRFMEVGDMGSLRHEIIHSFASFLDHWDFNHIKNLN